MVFSIIRLQQPDGGGKFIDNPIWLVFVGLVGVADVRRLWSLGAKLKRRIASPPRATRVEAGERTRNKSGEFSQGQWQLEGGGYGPQSYDVEGECAVDATRGGEWNTGTGLFPVGFHDPTNSHPTIVKSGQRWKTANTVLIMFEKTENGWRARAADGLTRDDPTGR